MTLTLLYATAALLITYLLAVSLKLSKTKTQSSKAAPSCDLALLPNAPKVVEKRVQINTQPDIHRERQQKSSPTAENSGRAWYEQKIQRPLPEAHRRAGRGCEQFYLRDLDPNFAQPMA